MATFLYYGEFAHFGYCENWIASALDRNGHHCLRIARNKWFDEERLIRLITANRADYLLISKAPEIEPAQLELVRERTGVRIVWWTFDWMRHEENWKWYGPLARVSDICFQTDGTDEDGFYRENGIRRVELHQGAALGLHDMPRSFQTALGADLTFIGSNYTERRHQLIAELGRYPNFQKYGEPGVQLWGAEFASACYFSKIVIGDNFVNDVRGYWSDRVYLALACGAFFLTAYVPGIEDLADNHRQLVWWKSFDELHEKIRYFLPREAERRAIALRGYRMVHVRHTYDHRVVRLTNHLKLAGL